MLYTKENLARIFPGSKAEVLNSWVGPLNAVAKRYNINTPARAAAFIAQVGHESGNLTAVIENLNYSQQALRRVFGKYFPTDALAAKYARKPVEIASKVYANRMGNGPEESRDGWTYRGRGLIQCTGKGLYEQLAKDLGKTLADTVAYLETKEGAAMSAGWFWNKNSLNDLADQNRFTDMTKRINGGTNGLDHRKELWAKAKSAIK